MKKVLLLPLLASITYANTQVNSINFENLSRISSKVALENVGFKQGDNYSIKQINHALKKFYKFGYFDDISVENNDGDIIFKFIEKPSIVNIEISGYKTRKDDLEILYKAMGIKKGSMYSEQRIAEAKNAILNMLQQEGYYNSVVEVSIENVSKSSVALAFEVNKGDEITITKINYKGAKHFDEGDFEDVVANKEKESFSWLMGRNDGEMKLDQLKYEHARIRELYLENGFLDARVSKAFSKIDFNTNRSEVNFSIVEGKQYQTGKLLIFVDKDIKDPKELSKGLKLKKEKTFNIKNLRKDIEYIKTEVANQGYAFAQVKYDIQKDEKTNIANINFNVIPGEKVYINDVIISGNTRTLDRVIRRDVYLAPKDLYSLTDFKESKNALKRSGFFDSVNIEQERVSANKMNLLVDVVEAKTGNLILGGGYGSYDGFMVNASINDNNIFGSGKKLGFKIDASQRTLSFDLSLSNPAINDSEYSGSFHIYNTSSEVDETDSNDTVSNTLTTEKVGISVGAGKKISRHTSAGINYKLESVSESNTDIVNNTDTSYITSAITPYIKYNTTDDFYLPRNGQKFSSTLEIAGLGGDSKYVKNINTFKTFHSLEEYVDMDWILRYRASIKILEDLGKIHDGDTFYLGGVKSVRGFESYAFGPEDNEPPYKRFAANSLELSMPLIPSAKMRWGIFLDAGMIGKENFTDITKAGYGAQLEWFSPVGPLSFIFANALNADTGDKTSSFEFSLGSSF